MTRYVKDTLSKVNSVPTGLQSLLGNVNQGVNPHELDHKIAPGVDLYPHWTANRLNIAFATAEVSGTTGQGVGITIPDGEIWQPIAMSSEYELVGTSDDIGMSNGIQKLGTGYYVAINRTTQDLNVTGLAGQFIVACGGFPDRVFLNGAWQFWSQIDAANDATVRTMTLQVLYAKLSD